MVSRLLRQKGVREFVSAAAVCRRSFPHAQFLLAGEADPGHPDAVPAAWIEQVQTRGTIRYVGFIKSIEVALAKADLVVLASYREGMPRVLLEAAACGTPAVTTDTPGCRDAVEHGTTGLIVPPRDASALAAAIAGLLADPARRQRMGRAARRRAVAQFDTGVIAGQHLDIYRRLGIPLNLPNRRIAA
jgi:glycosyltransferase involved in cell wall biosynthesis